MTSQIGHYLPSFIYRPCGKSVLAIDAVEPSRTANIHETTRPFSTVGGGPPRVRSSAPKSHSSNLSTTSFTCGIKTFLAHSLNSSWETRLLMQLRPELQQNSRGRICDTELIGSGPTYKETTLMLQSKGFLERVFTIYSWEFPSKAPSSTTTRAHLAGASLVSSSRYGKDAVLFGRNISVKELEFD